MISSLKTYINKKRGKKASYILIVIILLVFLGFKVEFDPLRLIKGLPDMMGLFKRMLHPNLSYGSEVMVKLYETIQIALVSSVLGMVLALPFSLLIAENIAPSQLLARFLTALFSFLRTIPSLIWAALLVSIFSIGKFSGIVALAIIAFLMSLKLFREFIEGINENQLNSTRSVGASSLQVLRYCVLPYMLDLTISVFFIVFETNIRSATILGLVGAGGIGQIMWRDLNHLRYDNLATLILILFSTIFLIDILSMNIRKALNRTLIHFKSLASYKKYKNASSFLISGLFLLIVVLAFRALDITGERLALGLSQGLQVTSRMAKMDFSYYPKLLDGIKESFYIAVFASLSGSIFAIVFSYLSAYNTSPAKKLPYLVKAFTNILRTFPPIITAIIFFRGIGPGPLAGAMALSIYTTGSLTKMYSEVLEGSKRSVQESILATGASNFQSFRYGLFPQTFPSFISLALYRMESNIRNSTILGVIGAGGVGTILAMNISWRNWEKVGLLLMGISLMIIGIDSLSSFIRKKI